MVSKLRAGIRQDVQPAEQNMVEDQAALDLAASALLDDRGLMGPSLVLLSARSCSAACARWAARRVHPGPIP